MVTRPDDMAASRGPKGIPNDPPYPMSPKSEIMRPVVQRHTKPQASSSKAPAGQGKAAANDDSESDWEKDGMEDEDSDWEIENKPAEVPQASMKHKASREAGLPASLRPGPADGVLANKKSRENIQAAASQVSLPVTSVAGSSIGASQISLPQYTIPPAVIPFDSASQARSYTTTPSNAGDAIAPSHTLAGPSGFSGQPPAYTSAERLAQPPAEPIKKQSTGEQIFGVEGNSDWPQNSNARVTYDGVAELPAVYTPREEFSQLNLGRPSPQSSQPPLIPVETEIDAASRQHAHAIPQSSQPWQQQQDWDRVQRERSQVEAAIALENERQAEQMRRAEEELHSAEVERREREQDEEMRRAESRPDLISASTDVMPDGSPIPPPPPRNANQAPLRSALRQAPEHYAIKQLRWFDARVEKMRTSPILIQNVNGPCPLLALVNALVLSTPESKQTGLVETLRTREQVSLDLVIDAVFDELTSGTRGTTDELPDVAELLQFLRNLHSGMNVNPRFTYIPDRASRELHPAYRPTEGPGGFEETKEMSLYSVFDISLVHGWIPARESAAYYAFQRSAKTYEDAQNIQFFEEELEHKLSTTGLSLQEQETFEDLHTIKDFLQTWPTQLTDIGLRTLLEHIKPGAFCILFRNDHFSLVYKEPKANQLMTLVTDSGYATHDEIAWESLVDVSGQGSEYFSGDFRPVSHNTQPTSSSHAPAGPRNSSIGGAQQIQSMLDVDGQAGDWTTVQNRRNRPSGQQQRPTANSQNFAPPSATQGDSDVARAEQEDHDLALALQLQEEEDARGRRETEARQRENVFEPNRTTNIPVDGPDTHHRTSSSNNNTTTTTNLALPARPSRNSNAAAGPRIPSTSGSNTISSSHNRRTSGRRQSAADQPPPPTYEQAAARPPFVPPADHPLNTGSGPPASSSYPYNSNPQQQHQQNWSGGGPGAGGGGMPAGVYGAGGGRYGHGRERDKCLVM